ncbi:MAG: alpha/beta hydrolase, partial [Sinomicrobium sp.]|nr:alpha/beta hydrolase [Sinomicrobium sp.]
VILVGHSMGGQAAIKFALIYPSAIEKLVLVAPAGLETFSEAEAALLKNTFTETMVANTTEEQIEKNYEINFFALPEDASKMIADRKQIRFAADFDDHCRAIVKSISGMLDEPVFDALERIPHETLVIFGKNDMLIPNRYLHPGLTTEAVGAIALKKITNATLEFVKESGHFVQFEKSGEVNALIQRFADRN